MNTVTQPGFSAELPALSAAELAAITGGFDFLQAIRAGNDGAVQGARIGGVIGAGHNAGHQLGAW